MGEMSVNTTEKGRQRDNKIPAAGWVMNALIKYRESIGLSQLPSRSDDAPAIFRCATETTTQWKIPRARSTHTHSIER